MWQPVGPVGLENRPPLHAVWTAFTAPDTRGYIINCLDRLSTSGFSLFPFALSLSKGRSAQATYL